MNGEKNRMKEKKFTIVFLIQPLYGSLFVICINTKLRGSLGKPSIITLRRLQDIAGLGRKVKRSIWTGAKPGRASGYRGCWLSFSISIYHLNNTAPREGSLVLQRQNNWTCHYRIFDSNCGSGSKSWGEGGGHQNVSPVQTNIKFKMQNKNGAISAIFISQNNTCMKRWCYWYF